jgi:hypothetical protein
MAETLRRAECPIWFYRSLGLFVLAPAKQIDDGAFSSQMNKEAIRGALLTRVKMYEEQPNHFDLQKWLDEWALPLIDRMERSCCSWQSIIDRIWANHIEYGASFWRNHDGTKRSYSARLGGLSRR